MGGWGVPEVGGGLVSEWKGVLISGEEMCRAGLDLAMDL